MKKGTKVSWQMPSAVNRGLGTTISDEVDGCIFVAVETLDGTPNPGYHQVIYCAATWLIPIESNMDFPSP